MSTGYGVATLFGGLSFRVPDRLERWQSSMAGAYSAPPRDDLRVKQLTTLVSIVETITRAVLFHKGFALDLRVAARLVDFPMGNSTAQPALGYIQVIADPRWTVGGFGCFLFSLCVFEKSA